VGLLANVAVNQPQRFVTIHFFGLSSRVLPPAQSKLFRDAPWFKKAWFEKPGSKSLTQKSASRSLNREGANRANGSSRLSNTSIRCLSPSCPPYIAPPSSMKTPLWGLPPSA